MLGLIAEIGNHHNGDFQKAKDLITAAKECGASYAKLQAIDPIIAQQSGSMPLQFYQRCAFNHDQYRDLVTFGAQIGIDVFYSFFGMIYEFARIDSRYGNYHKISGKQAETWPVEKIAYFNTERSLISIPYDMSRERLRRVSSVSYNMNVMVVTPYPPFTYQPTKLDDVQQFYDQLVGFSDHSVGIENCIDAIDRGCLLIEKHFYLGDVIECDGKIYRDCEHSANPEELRTLAQYLKGKLNA